MHFQKHEQYAILFMSELARIGTARRLSLIEMSKRHGISLPFLKKIVRTLHLGGLTESKEGLGGGYVLGRTPDKITLWDIIRTFDGNNDVSRVQKVKRVDCPVNRVCLPQHIRSTVMTAIEDRLRSITLQEVSL